VEALASQFLRAIRGSRSQVAFSRRLGFKSNVAASWEAGRRFPSADATLTTCARLLIDVPRSLETFNRSTASLIEMRGKGLTAQVSRTSLAHWLDAQRGHLTITDVAERTGFSTFKMSRVFAGKSGLRLPDFLVVLDAITGRVTDFIAALVNIEQVPLAREEHARINTSRELAFTEPWTSAVVALLETESYRALQAHSDGFVARELGISAEVATRSLRALVEAGLIERCGSLYRVQQALTIDTRSHPERTQRLRQNWAAVATRRLAQQGPRDLFAYNVFSISQDDYERVRELQKQYFREVRSIVAGSEPAQCVALMTQHLIRFGTNEDC
jgi:hypothetical protein